MKCSSLTNEEIAANGGFTHRLDFSYRDIGTGIANNTAKTWSTGFLPAIPAESFHGKCELHLTDAFEDLSDAAFNTSTISFGTVTTPTRYINASEANRNGTEVIDVVPGTNPNDVIAAAGQYILTLNAMANKTVSDLDKGQAYILFEVHSAGAKPREQATPFGDGRS